MVNHSPACIGRVISRSVSAIAFVPTRLQSNASRIVIFDFQTIQHIYTRIVGVDIDVITNDIKNAY